VQDHDGEMAARPGQPQPSCCRGSKEGAQSPSPSAIGWARDARFRRKLSPTRTCCDVDGVAVFDALHRRHKATNATLYAFDLLEFNGEDLRPLPLAERKAKMARLLARKPLGIAFNEHTDADGATVFRHACKLGLEGIVSKRLGAPYRSGPSRDWLKVKNPDSPAMVRHREGRW
jgi:hypothetical protein